MDDVTQAASQAAARARRRAGPLDMLVSLAVVVLAVGLVLVLLPHHHYDAVKTVGYQDEVVAARRAAEFPLVGPTGLAPGWRATSVRVTTTPSATVTALHIGFVTPAGQYAALEEGSAPVADFLRQVDQGSRALGTQQVNGVGWERRSGGPQDRALVLAVPGRTIVVLGTASYAELAQLAASLR